MDTPGLYNATFNKDNLAGHNNYYYIKWATNEFHYIINTSHRASIRIRMESINYIINIITFLKPN